MGSHKRRYIPHYQPSPPACFFFDFWLPADRGRLPAVVCGGLGLNFFAAGEVVGPLFFCVTDLAVVSKSRVVFPVWCE